MVDYTSESIEVLSGLDPVKKRPGMYTEVENPNHIGQEVIDNSVDEAMAEHATCIKVVLFDDLSISLSARAVWPRRFISSSVNKFRTIM